MHESAKPEVRVPKIAPGRPVAVPPRPGYIRVGKPDVHPTTPSHTRGTSRGEEWIFRIAEKGRRGKARTARSSTSIGPASKGPIDSRMPHLPPP